LKGKRFDGTIRNCPGISVAAEDGMVKNYYSDCSFLIVRLGAVTDKAGSDQADRKYGLLFKSMVIGIPDKMKNSVGLLAKID
jgi:hypothetical protein